MLTPPPSSPFMRRFLKILACVFLFALRAGAQDATPTPTPTTSGTTITTVTLATSEDVQNVEYSVAFVAGVLVFAILVWPFQKYVT